MLRSIPLLAALISTPSLARADGDVAMHDAFWWIRTLELVIPDARWEHSFTAGDNRWVLSLPLVIRAGHVNTGSDSTESGRGYPGGIIFTHVAEFQWQVTNREFRGLLGERVHFHGEQEELTGLMPFVEAGALLGTDGSGGVIGVGLAWGDGMAGLSAGVVVRGIATTQEYRGDIGFDLHFPFNAL